MRTIEDHIAPTGTSHSKLTGKPKHAPGRTLLGLGLLLCSNAAAQNTQPLVSTLLGGGGRDEITAICRGPGPRITVAGYTDSLDLPVTAGSLQVSSGGSYDAFVAQFDPTQPPQSQLLWCTYLGGNGRDYAFDVEVDPNTGIVTVVGSTESTSFPATAGSPLLQPVGQSDGFLVQLDPTGSTLLASTLIGGTDTDRLSKWNSIKAARWSLA